MWRKERTSSEDEVCEEILREHVPRYEQGESTSLAAAVRREVAAGLGAVGSFDGVVVHKGVPPLTALSS